ncbi:related to trfA protein [Rhynchosporium secalis]|uniref:Related to trfA protein n=1 Tax=Rhynchosporium secalis TaxID=38038 RepID=A0A1E1M6X8_RHYSE|nr:related to trfA protein [Rhynchosporium secalis]
MTSISIPTSAAFHPTQLIPATHPAVFKTLYRLSRPSLLSLVLDWLDERNEGTSAVYLVSSSEDPDIQSSYSPAHSLSELREVYEDLQAKKGSKRDVVDRIIEGDWRNGISLYQLAMADMQYLYDHPASQKWTALKIVRLSPSTDKKPPSIPRFHPATFLQNLQREVLPDVKAHYNFDRHVTLPLTILRIFILESPYNTTLALQGKQKVLDSTKTFYVAFPDSSPYIYVSLAAPTIRGSTSDNKSLRKLMLEGIPKAFSKPRERYKLESTSLSARNLDALIEQRGGGRTNSAGGGWSVYVSGSKSTDTPLNIQRPTPETDQLVPQEESEDSTAQGMKRKHIFNASTQKRRKLLAASRFGNTGLLDDEKGIERLDIQIQDTFPSTVQVEDEDIWDPDPSLTSYQQKRGRRSTTNFEVSNEDEEVQAEGWRPDVRITFQGQHVFAGIRKLVEEGIVDGQMMPGWMTGEDGVSLGIVKEGRIKVFKGSGI